MVVCAAVVVDGATLVVACAAVVVVMVVVEEGEEVVVDRGVARLHTKGRSTSQGLLAHTPRTAPAPAHTARLARQEKPAAAI